MLSEQVATQPNRVLVIGNDDKTIRRLRAILEQYGYQCLIVAELELALGEVGDQEIAGVIWSVNRIEQDSIVQLQILKGHAWGTPLLAVMGNGSAAERCALLDAGVDACIDATCGDREIAASLAALRRMVGRLATLGLFDTTFRLDSRERRLHRFDCSPARSVFLPQHEFLLFRLLALSPLRTVPYAVIDSCVWDRSMQGNEASRRKLVDRLRSLLAGLGGGLKVLADRGLGLRLERNSQ